MPLAPRWSPDEDVRLRQLYDDGLSLGAIAKEMGRAKGTISTHAEYLGLSWGAGRTKMQKAVETNAAAGRRRREELKAALLEDALRLRGQVWAPTTYFDWGGKDHEYDERDVDEPTHTDKLKLVQAISTAVGTYAKLDQLDVEREAAQARSMLEKLADAMGVKGPTQ